MRVERENGKKRIFVWKEQIWRNASTLGWQNEWSNEIDQGICQKLKGKIILRRNAKEK
jgi:hypothetical protein